VPLVPSRRTEIVKRRSRGDGRLGV
jgi:hypothetical protein